jgi:neutral ceramidase
LKGALDDIFARDAVFKDGSNAAALSSLDVVMLEWEHVKLIREGASRSAGLRPDSVMVACTHNHACPAVIERGSFKREGRYIESLVKKSIEALVKAASRVERAETGAGYGFEGRISFNRRFIMKDGTVITQPPPDRLDEVLANEGVIDPGVGVLCARRPDGKIAGAVVNFASHAVHHMGQISAGYPGVLSRRIKEMYGEECVCLFLNGACGNIHNVNYACPGRGIVPKEECGVALAEAAGRVIGGIEFKSGGVVDVKERAVNLRYRGCSKLEELVKHPE